MRYIILMIVWPVLLSFLIVYVGNRNREEECVAWDVVTEWSDGWLVMAEVQWCGKDMHWGEMALGPNIEGYLRAKDKEIERLSTLIDCALVNIPLEVCDVRVTVD